jgi:hypothetical protein
MKVTNLAMLPSTKKRRVSSMPNRTRPKKRRSLLNLYASKLLSARLYQPFPTSLNEVLQEPTGAQQLQQDTSAGLQPFQLAYKLHMKARQHEAHTNNEWQFLLWVSLLQRT